MYRVKICGITNLEDAVFACEAGADALGFVFYPKSPRYISAQKALEIVEKLPPFVQKVGLFVNESPKDINRTMMKARMNLAQIHFEVEKSFFDKLDFEYLRVIRAKKKDDLANLPKDGYLLVDAFVESYGGEGKRVNLEWFKEVDCSRIILAGGLNKNNLEELKGYDFYGVDVSSSVEFQKGKKDPQKVKNFIRLAKNI